MTELETNARFEFVGGMLDSLRSELASAMKMKNPQLYRIVQALIWNRNCPSVRNRSFTK